MKKQKKFGFFGMYLVLSWFGTTVLTLLFAILLLVNLTFPRNALSSTQTHYQMYKALPASVPNINQQDTAISKGDAREIIIANFFENRKAPLAEVAQKFIEVADRYNIDYRLLPAIAMQESQGGKRMPANSFNPFGYGVYGAKVMKFNSFEEAIEKVAQGLRNNYLDQGLITPEQIMAKYTPPALEKGGSWAIGVAAFMEQLR